MPLWWDADAGEYIDGPWSQSDIDWYRSLGAKLKPFTPLSAIPMDDQPCKLCGGAGELRDDSGYGFETITTCTCAGTGSRAHIITERTTK